MSSTDKFLTPDFIGVGAAKAGTTTLHDLLNQHPDIYLPSFKEAHFFDYDKNYQQGMKWYQETVFGGYSGQQIKGEITPSYLYFEDVPNRIFELFGQDVKLIMMFRHPVDRAWSHYQMHFLRGNESLSFEQAIVEEQNRIKQDDVSKARYSYIQRGLYAEQVERYLKLFPRENIHFILFEDFIKDPKSHISSVLGFLDLPNVDINYGLKSNVQSKQRSWLLARVINKPHYIKSMLKPLIPGRYAKNIRQSLQRMNAGKPLNNKIDIELRNKLFEQYYFEDTVKLSKLINLDLSSWMQSK